MQVVLTQDVPKLGKKGEVVNVKEGYWRNYLSSNELALKIDEDKAKQLSQVAREEGEREQIELHELERQAEKIGDKELVINVKVGDKKQLFSAVNEAMIRSEIQKQWNVEIQEVKSVPIKTLGKYSVKVNLGHSVDAVVKINIISSK